LICVNAHRESALPGLPTPKEDLPVDSGDMMFVNAVVIGMALFAVTLFGVTWYVNRR
jgi:hypothetical protein